MGDGGDQYTGLDRFGRVIDQRWIKDSSGADLERVQYGFDRASNRVWRDNTVADALTAKQDEFYTYDGLNQLLTLQRGTLNSGKTGINGTPTWEEDFTIDPTGNWDNYVNQVNGTTTLNQPRTHNAVNEVETISGSSSLMAQNAAGNMVKAPQPLDWGSAYAMTYDAWQRLVQVKSGSATVATYAYDGQNRRTTKATLTTSTRHYYYSSQWQILEERLNTTTTADRQFVWGLMGLDNLILRDRGTERFYSLQDVFSCTAIVDTAGTVQERYGYNAFGLSRVMDSDFNVISTSSYDWETRYDNYRYDSESNFYQVRNRYLHPTLGRWIIQDIMAYEDGPNFYTYVINNPTGYIDPMGLTYKEIVKTVPLSTIRGFPNQSNWFASTGATAPAIRGTGGFTLTTEGGKCCASIKKAKKIDVTVTTMLPTANTIVGIYVTASGLQSIEGHEARRRSAYKHGYDAYLEPVQLTGSLATKCGTLCCTKAGEAESRLQTYIDNLRADAISKYNSYTQAQMTAISVENSHWLPPQNGLLPGYDPAWIHTVKAPKAYKGIKCPTCK